MPKLIVLAAIWNEAEFLPYWISQIEALQPDAVLISEGCFDLKKPANSTDGSDRILNDWLLTSKLKIKLIKPVRKSRVALLSDYLAGQNLVHPNLQTYLANLISVFRRFHLSSYRHNQAMTFSKMLNIGVSEVGNDTWFMTSDCDQFYSSDFLKNYRSWLDQEASYFSGREHTFLMDTFSYSVNYEQRGFNNLPIRVKKGLSVLPTRHFCTLEGIRLREICRQSNAIAIDSGLYYHFKLLLRKRSKLAYEVGGRNAPLVNENELIACETSYWNTAPDHVRDLVRDMT